MNIWGPKVHNECPNSQGLKNYHGLWTVCYLQGYKVCEFSYAELYVQVASSYTPDRLKVLSNQFAKQQNLPCKLPELQPTFLRILYNTGVISCWAGVIYQEP